MSFVRSGVANTFRVEMDDGSQFTCRSTVADVIRWESNNGGRSFTDNMSSTAFMQVAYYAARRTGEVDVKQWEQWFPHVVDFEIDDASDADPDPTQPGPSDA